MPPRKRAAPKQPPVEAPAARALRVARQGAKLREQHDAWTRERLVAVAQLIREGYSHVDIADLLQVSKPRAGQLVTEARAAGLLDDDPERHPVAV